MRPLQLFEQEQTSEEAEIPDGLRYQRDLIDAAYERELLSRIHELPFREFEFHGHLGKRRIVSFGWRYRYSGRGSLEKAEAIPEFLLPLRTIAGSFADLPASTLEQVLVTEYAPGAGIGWHRDKTVFDEVVGISLLAPCLLRFRCPVGDQPKRQGARTLWQRRSLQLVPRSGYLLTGPARTEWEHSILAVDELRYSITFRSLEAANVCVKNAYLNDQASGH